MPNDYAINSYPAAVGKVTLVVERENEVIAINIADVREVMMTQEYEGVDEIKIRYNNWQHNMRIFQKEQVYIPDEIESTAELEDFLSQFQRSELNA